jgi:glucokinase
MMKNYIGIDIGGTKCAVVLGCINEITNMLEIKSKYKFNTYPNLPFDVLQICVEKIAEYQKFGDICGIGISCGGPLNSTEGIILSPPNLPNWDTIRITDYFKERFSIPVYLQNDANACVVAEWKYGAGKGYKNIVFLTFGTGLGAGLILNGKLYAGTNDMAGEVGHIRLQDIGPLGYGKYGSFEGFCSGGGIERHAKSKINKPACANLVEVAGGTDGITAKLIAELAETGDPFCINIYAECGKMLGYGLSIIIDILNPELIIIGSIFTRSSHLLWQYAKEIIEKEALYLSATACTIVSAKLGENIGDFAALSIATGIF